MAPRLLLLAPVLLLALALAACGESEELAPSPSAGGTTETPAAVSPTPVETATPIADATPLTTPPADWATYQDADGRFTIKYPDEWTFKDDASLDRPAGELTAVMASFPLDGSLKEFPADGLKVDFYVDTPTAGGDCREPPEESTPAKLGELSGWQRFQPLDEPGVAGSLMVAAYHDGFCYTLIGYFGEDNANDPAFWQLAASFDLSEAS